MPEQQAQVPVAEDFFFKVEADTNGITELTFKKDAVGVFSTLFAIADFVNNSFDTPFPSVGDFLRDLAGTADKIEATLKAHEQANQPGNAEEVSAG